MTRTLLPFLLHGSPEPPPPRIPLRAGPFSLVYQAGDLRNIGLGPHEAVRRIYGAVRDSNWGTVPGTLENESVEVADDAFRITYDSRHHQGPIRFTWHATVTGRSDGTLRFRFEGRAESTFLRNRIGLCVLHPIRECAGRPCRIHHSDGSASDALFPGFVSDRQPIPGFHDLAALAYDITDGVSLEIQWHGETFETEDQRNWIDASFKTYGTSLALPFPVEIPEGTRIVQEVEIRLAIPNGLPSRLSPASPRNPTSPPITDIRCGPDARLRLPEVGLSCASHGRPLGPVERERLTAIGLSHLRLDLHLASLDWPDALRVAALDALELGVPLELATHFSGHASSDDAAAQALLALLRRHRVDLVRILVLQDGRPTTSAGALATARTHFADLGVPLGVGTAADLCQLHLHPPPDGADFLAWSMNPQVHAFDLASLAETPEGAAHQAVTVARNAPHLPRVVGPITLRPRCVPVAAPDPNVPTDALHPSEDGRQASLFGAGWTLAMINALASAGVESLTFFETSGRRGILESADGSPPSRRFPSLPGAVFPMFHLFADLAPYSRASVVFTESSHPTAVAAFALRQGHETVGWCANLTDQPRTVRISGLGPDIRLRSLEASNVVEAVMAPETYRARPLSHFPTEDRRRTLDLPPFALVHWIGRMPRSGTS